MPKRGLEQPPYSTGKTPLSETGGAESGAVGAAKPSFDPDLARLIEIWPSLSEASKRAILETVSADADRTDRTLPDTDVPADG